jgi:two-component system CheB/CheR fusion protein
MPARPPAPAAAELLALLLDQSHDYALFLTTPAGIVTDWYPGAEHIFGFAAEEMVGENATRLFNSEDVARGAAAHEMEVARTASRAEDDRWHVRKDGTRFWGSGVLFALHDHAGQLVGYAKVVRNRTDVKTQTEALENQAKALSEAERRDKVVLATVAHELRNPLSALVNAAHLLRNGEAPPGALQIVDRQLALLRRLADDLMEASRLGAGKGELRLAVLDLRDVFYAAAEAVRPLAAARGQEFQAIPIAGPVPVRGDAQRLEQVFVNLLDNAIKYTPRGGRIVFNITIEGGDAIVRVEDSGVGMSAEVLPKIFDLFTQEDASRAHAGGGLGLGLALVRDLVTLHGGTVQARSDGRDKGSVFTVRLPQHAAKQP